MQLRELVKTQVTGPTPVVSDQAGPGWGSGICISKKSPAGLEMYSICRSTSVRAVLLPTFLHMVDNDDPPRSLYSRRLAAQLSGYLCLIWDKSQPIQHWSSPWASIPAGLPLLSTPALSPSQALIPRTLSFCSLDSNSRSVSQGNSTCHNASESPGELVQCRWCRL